MALYDIDGNVIIQEDNSSDKFTEKVVNLLDSSTIKYGKRFADNKFYDTEGYCCFDVDVEYGKVYYSNITRIPVIGDMQTGIVVSGLSGFSIFGIDADGNEVTNGVSDGQSAQKYDGSTPFYHNYCTIHINNPLVVKVRITTKIIYSLTTKGEYDGMFSEEFFAPNINSYGVEYLGYEYGDNLYDMSTNAYLGLVEKMEDDSRIDIMLNYKGINPNPIYGKKIAFLGDSNLQYNMDIISNHFKEVYGATVVKSYATAGQTWSQPNGDSTALDKSGVGQVNQLCADFINEGDVIMNDEIDIIIIMLGTNDKNFGTPITSEGDLTTAIGAMDWGFKKLSYYARNKKIGILNVPRTNDIAETVELDETTGKYYVPLAETPKQQYVRVYAQKYCFPIFETALEGRMISDALTKEYASQNYIFGDGVHLGVWCWEHLLPMLGKWVAYKL